MLAQRFQPRQDDAGVIDVASDVVETPEEVADTICQALNLCLGNGCSRARTAAWRQLGGDVAWRELEALAAGAKLAKKRFAAT